MFEQEMAEKMPIYNLFINLCQFQWQVVYRYFWSLVILVKV